MSSEVKQIDSVEEAIHLTLGKDAFESAEQILELIRFMIDEEISSNKSFVLGSSVLLTNKDIFVKFLRSKTKADLNYVIHKRIKMNRDAIRFIQTHIPSPLTFKTDVLYFNRTVVDRVSTITVATEQYVYKRIRTGLRDKDGLVVDSSKLSPKDLIALLNVVKMGSESPYQDRHGNYIGLEMIDGVSGKALDLSIHGKDGEYHSGLAVPSKILDAARMVLAGIQ